MKRPTKLAKSVSGAKKDSTAASVAVRRAKKEPSSRSAPNTPARSSYRPDSKLGIVIGMLRSTKGATIEALSKATGWQTHSVRGSISGAIKKRLGFTVASTKADGVRTYRISD